MMNKLPKGWLRVEFGEITEIVSGGTPKSGNDDFFTEPPNGIAWITPADLSGYNEKYISHGKRNITESGYKSCSAKIMPKGSVLFSSRAPIGYVAIAKNEICTNQGFKSFVINNNLISSDYLYYYLKHIKDLADSLGTGTTFKEISGSTCKKLPFILPPKAEQDHIAELLDNHLSQVARISQKLNGILPIIKNFRQSVLAQAVSGELTEDWCKKNNFSAETEYDTLVKNENQKEKNIKEKIKLRQDIKFKKEISLFDSWIKLPFFEFCLLNRGFDLPASQRIEGDYPIISSSGYSGTHNTYSVKAPCVTVGRSGSVGKVFYYNQNCWALNTALYVKDFGFSDPKFIYWKLISLDLAQYSSSTAVPTLNRNVFMFEMIDIPPLAEQRQIVETVERLFALADNLETQVKQALERVEHLTQSILHQAFIGNLSRDWREQHPELITGEHSAEALLALLQEQKPKKKK